MAHIHYIFKYSQIQNTGGFCCSGTNVLLTFVFSSSTWGERHNSYNANHLSDPTNVQCIPRYLRSLSVEICKTTTTYLNGRELNSLCPSGRDLNYLPAWSNANLQLTLFQNPQILSPSLLGMTSSTLQPISCLGVYYKDGDCHILCKRM